MFHVHIHDLETGLEGWFEGFNLICSGENSKANILRMEISNLQENAQPLSFEEACRYIKGWAEETTHLTVSFVRVTPKES